MIFLLLKRIFDACLSVIGIIFSLPFWLVVAVIIKLQDWGGVFYFQERVGMGGKIFKSLQFRSMVVDAEKNTGPVQSLPHDPRITGFGRILRITAMDELPQLLNILIGDISFVGPRALRPVEIDGPERKLKSVWEFEGFKERCAVRPGLTGVAQILLPRDAPRDLKIKYDLWYIKHQGFWLDIYLMLLSFLVTFRGKWESREDKFGKLLSGIKSNIEKEIG